jgi:hypothetical protein
MAQESQIQKRIRQLNESRVVWKQPKIIQRAHGSTSNSNISMDDMYDTDDAYLMNAISSKSSSGEFRGPNLARHMPSEMLTNILSFVDLPDLPYVASTSSAMRNAVRNGMPFRTRMDLVEVPRFVVENPNQFESVPRMKTLSLTGTRAGVTDLSHTTIETLIIESCNLQSLILPPTLKHIHINKMVMQQPLNLSHLNLETIDVRNMSQDIVFPHNTAPLCFFRSSNYATGFQTAIHYLKTHQFPKLAFVDILFNNSNHAIPFENFENMTALETLCCSSDMIVPQAIITGVKRVILYFENREFGEAGQREYAVFPDAEMMTAIFDNADVLDTPIDLPPRLHTLILQGNYFIPMYWDPYLPHLERLVVFCVNPNPNDIEYSLPAVDYFRIGFASDNAAFFENNPHLNEFKLEDHDGSLGMLQNFQPYKYFKLHALPIKQSWTKHRGLQALSSTKQAKWPYPSAPRSFFF